MEEKLEYLIQNKQWSELDAYEREIVLQELGSEERFTAMKKVDNSLVTMDKVMVTPDPRILLSLRMAGKKFEKQSFRGVFAWKMPAIAAAFFVAIAAFAGWYVGRSSIKMVAPTHIVVTDTVYVKAPHDTVFVNRVVYRDRFIVKTMEQKKSFTVVNQTEKIGVGVSMKDKEELQRLLVSGSE